MQKHLNVVQHNLPWIHSGADWARVVTAPNQAHVCLVLAVLFTSGLTRTLQWHSRVQNHATAAILFIFGTYTLSKGSLVALQFSDGGCAYHTWRPCSQNHKFLFLFSKTAGTFNNLACSMYKILSLFFLKFKLESNTPAFFCQEHMVHHITTETNFMHTNNARVEVLQSPYHHPSTTVCWLDHKRSMLANPAETVPRAVIVFQALCQSQTNLSNMESFKIVPGRPSPPTIAIHNPPTPPHPRVFHGKGAP